MGLGIGTRQGGRVGGREFINSVIQLEGISLTTDLESQRSQIYRDFNTGQSRYWSVCSLSLPLSLPPLSPDHPTPPNTGMATGHKVLCHTTTHTAPHHSQPGSPSLSHYAQEFLLCHAVTALVIVVSRYLILDRQSLFQWWWWWWLYHGGVIL